MTAGFIGAMLPSANFPKWVVIAGLVVPLIVVMVTGYLSAWRQGHSGLFVVPIINGPFGLKGLRLKMSRREL